jgi:hypothetical protein
MQHALASQTNTANETTARDHGATTPTVGPLGGIIFCALVLAAYVALVVAVAMS